MSFINSSNFVNIIMFNDLKFRNLTSFRWSITVQLPLLWVPQENLSWYSVRNVYHKLTIAIICSEISCNVK